MMTICLGFYYLLALLLLLRVWRELIPLRPKLLKLDKVDRIAIYTGTTLGAIIWPVAMPLGVLWGVIKGPKKA